MVALEYRPFQLLAGISCIFMPRACLVVFYSMFAACAGFKSLGSLSATLISRTTSLTIARDWRFAQADGGKIFRELIAELNV